MMTVICVLVIMVFFFFKQKTAYEMRISDWSSDVCSSDLNMKTAVDRVGRGKERQVNIRFLAMTNHYVFAPEFCNPAAGWEKGQVEKNVQDARDRKSVG